MGAGDGSGTGPPSAANRTGEWSDCTAASSLAGSVSIASRTRTSALANASRAAMWGWGVRTGTGSVSKRTEHPVRRSEIVIAVATCHLHAPGRSAQLHFCRSASCVCSLRLQQP